MKAISFSEFGSIDVLELVDIDIPSPKPTEVLIKNVAIGVNYVDVQHRQGGFYYDVPLGIVGQHM